MSSVKSTKKDLEAKIAELEEKLAKLANQIESAPKPQVTTPPPAPKPQVQTPPPAPKPEGEVVPAWEQWRSAPTSDFHS
ncbi:MAG: hypothetical protein ACKO7Y_03420, partial [Candidatus Nitrosotenuis sp.]